MILDETINAKDAWLKQVKHHRRRLKGLPRVGFNPNAGNVEYNISMMNKMLGSGEMISNNPISGPFGGDVSAPAGGASMGESLDEALNNPDMIKFLKKHKEDFIENKMKNWTSIYADAYVSYEESFIPRLTELILSKDKVDPLDNLNYVPEHYAEGLDRINLVNDNDLVIGENISGIGTAAFQSCEVLNRVIIEEGCTTIGDSAFRGCLSLSEVTLPSTIKFIGNNAFSDCWQLTDIYYNGYCSDWERININGVINRDSEFGHIHCLDDDYFI
ncbi:MAG: leucine-rich repeat domain-containing protein [Acholeplasmatales bacterium]|nr:leucine-rich repeat domain-containing protein [Acholeplasmatales bacterium]